MSAQPFMQVYVADYTADTQHLTCEEDGAYWRLLRAMWRAGGSLPLDERKLSIICGLSAPAWKGVRVSVLPLFDHSGGLITQKRLAKELKKAREKSQKRALAGKLGGEANALKYKQSDEAIAERLPNHSLEPEPEIESPISPNGEIAPQGAEWLEAPKSKKATRLSADWCPSDTDELFARSEGLTEEEIERATAEFRDHWLAQARNNTKLDWSRTWRNRIRAVADRKRERGARLAARPGWTGNGGQGPVDFGSIIARRRGFDQN